MFVQTDTLNQISELDRSNNILKASDVIDVKLTPPPDLRVDTIVIPSSSYSGKNSIIIGILFYFYVYTSSFADSTEFMQMETPLVPFIKLERVEFTFII